MTTSIFNVLIEQLSNNTEEIRVLALREINGKLKRIIASQNAGDPPVVNINGAFLVKSLVRWFGSVPLREEGTALETILLILESSYGTEIISLLKAERILIELNKIEFFLRRPDHLKQLNEIREVMRRYMIAEEAAKQQPAVDNDLRLDLSVLTARLTLNEQSQDTQFNAKTDMIKCWEVPGTMDLNQITNVKQSLLRPGSGDRSLRETIAVLPGMIHDMPGEFFLQPPYLYRSLFQLLDADPELAQTIQLLNRNLLGRIKFRQLAATYRKKDERELNYSNQISMAKYVRDCFTAVLEQLKRGLSGNASTVNQCLSIFTQLVEMALQDPYGTTESYDDLMQEFSDLCRFFRNTVQGSRDFISRKYYLEILNDLVKLIRRRALTLNHGYHPGDFQANGDVIDAKRATSWTSEVQVALLDVSIKIIYPQLYESIVAAVDMTSLKNPSLVAQLLHSERELSAAVKVLRDVSLFTPEQLIYSASEALDTLSIHESTRLIVSLMKAIASLHTKLFTDEKLRRTAEKVLLQLLAYPDTSLKRLVYQEMANSMKVFFSSIVDGERSVLRLHTEAEKAGGACNLGVPITVEILTEILCVGYPHSDGHVTAQSESILTLLVKGRNVLGRYWKVLQRVMVPVLPLMQAITNSYSSLSKSIVEMFDPDPLELPFAEILHGNVRFLFNEDASIRGEALVRLMYIVDSVEEAEEYTPNIASVSGNLPDDLCILEGAVEVTRRFSTEGHFDEGAVYALVNLLKEGEGKEEGLTIKGNNVALRKSALMQLNSMAADVKLNAIVHDLDAWYSILVVMDNALKVDGGRLDAPESVIPAVNLFCKMCIQFPEFRQQMAKEVKIPMLLLRSLVKYHHMAVLRPDCVLALFLLANSGYVEGGAMGLTTPLLFSRLLMPFVARTYHWMESPYYKPSRLEEAVTAVLRSEEGQTGMGTGRSGRSEHMSLHDFKMKLSASGGGGDAEGGGDGPAAVTTLDREVMWQFLRVSFASLWFDGFERMVESAEANGGGGLKYELSENSLDFNESLKVIRSDLSLIANTLPSNAFLWSVQAIQNATSHAEVVDNLMSLECVLRLNPNVQFNMKSLAKSLERFCLTIPSTEADERLFARIVTFLGIALESPFNGHELHSWVIKELKHSRSNFIGLLRGGGGSCGGGSGREVYQVNVQFLRRVLQCLVQAGRGKHAKKIALMVMNPVLDGLQERYERKELENVNGLVAVLRTMLVGVPDLLEDYSKEFALQLADKLLAYSVTSKITSCSGGAFLKNSLATILQLGRVIEKFHVDQRHFNLIIGLTGHVDQQVRALAWNLLERLTARVETARLVNEGLRELPGGLHGLAISTALDENEVDLVREVAGVVLANLLSHVDGQSGQLLVCPADVGREMGDGEIPWDLVGELLERHRFIERVGEFVERFSASEVVDIECEEEVVYCGTIRGFVAILIRLISLDGTIVERVFFESGLGQALVALISVVPVDVTPNTLELAAEICKLLIVAQRESGGVAVRERIILSNRALMGALVYLVNVNVFERSQFAVDLWRFGVYFVELLRQMVATEQGFAMLCQVLERNENGREFVMALLAGLRQEEDERVQLSVMQWVQVAFAMNLEAESEYITLLEMMDAEKVEVKVKEKGTRGENNNTENEDPNRPQREIQRIKEEKTMTTHMCLNRVLFNQLHRHFRIICASKSGSNLSRKKTATCKTLAVVLNASKEARDAAKEANLFEEIVNRFRETIESLGMSCVEFVRRYGEAKKAPVVDELELLFDMLLAWFAVESLEALQQVDVLCAVLLKLWSWLVTNQRLQVKCVRLLVLLSEDSVPVCKAFASQYSSVSPSVVQLLWPLIGQEMGKVKHPKFNMAVLRAGVRVLINCCCCVEGRVLMGKLGVMEYMDRLHPQVTKWQEPWLQITDLWLEFWEVYSRYPEGARVTHQNMLFSVVQRGGRGSSCQGVTRKALAIFRNMVFVADNRHTFLNSEVYMDMLRYILDADGSPKEHLLMVIVSIWKLLANSFKAKNKFKATTIPSKLMGVERRVAILPENEEHRAEILMTLGMIKGILGA